MLSPTSLDFPVRQTLTDSKNLEARWSLSRKSLTGDCTRQHSSRMLHNEKFEHIRGRGGLGPPPRRQTDSTESSSLATLLVDCKNYMYITYEAIQFEH